MDEEDNVDPTAEMLNEGGSGTPVTQQPPIDYQKMFEAMQQQNAQLVAQNAQLAQTVQQVANRPVTVQQPVNQPDPFEAFDDNTKKALKGVIDTMNNNFKQQLSQHQQQFANMALEQEIAQIAAIPNLTADQIKRAQDIFRGNRAKGIPINAQESVDVVIGQDFRAGKVNLGNRAPPPALTGGGRPPVPAKARPANFDKMSRKEQIAHFEADDALHSTPIQSIWDDPDV